MATVPTRALVEKYGMTPRYWIRMAADGKIPGAYQPSGEGGKWVFDPVAVSKWWASRQREVKGWPGYTVEGCGGGDVPSVPESSDANRLKRKIDEWRKSAFANG